MCHAVVQYHLFIYLIMRLIRTAGTFNIGNDPVMNSPMPVTTPQTVDLIGIRYIPGQLKFRIASSVAAQTYYKSIAIGIFTNGRFKNRCHKYRVTFIEVIRSFELVVKLMGYTVNSECSVIEFHRHRHLFFKFCHIIFSKNDLLLGTDLIPRCARRTKMDILTTDLSGKFCRLIYLAYIILVEKIFIADTVTAGFVGYCPAFAPAVVDEPGNAVEQLIIELGMIPKGSREGGFFTVIGRKPRSPR